MNENAAKISRILKQDCRYEFDAYEFVLEAVQKTAAALPQARYLAAEELLSGISKLARREFGAFDADVFALWGVKTASDIGNIVYNLIGVGVLFADERDRKSDFDIEFNLILPEDNLHFGSMPEVPKID